MRRVKNTQPAVNGYRKMVKKALFSNLLRALKFFEKLSCKVKSFGRLNLNNFYGPIVESEIELAELDERSKVAVIGSGPFPSTGILLARKGHEVTCVDIEAESIEYARGFLEKINENLEIKLIEKNGKDIDYSNYDAVWIALHVNPKQEVIAKAYEGIKEGGKVIFRTPSGMLKKFYPLEIPSGFRKEIMSKIQPLGKKSILLTKEEDKD